MGVENMNKKGMLARDFIIILVLFGAITGVAALIVSDMADSETGYNVTNMTDENFQSRYDTLSETTEDIELMQNATASGEGISVLSTFTTVFKATFNVISIVFGSFSIVNGVMVNFAEDFGVPSVVANIIFPAIFAIIMTIIIFVIISSVSKGRM